MKKFLFLFLMLLTGLNYIYSQTAITISEPDVPVVPCIYNPVAADLTGVTNPTTGTNMTWDYSSLTMTGAYSYQYWAAANPAFPTATLVDSGFSGTIIPGNYYYYGLYYNENANGFQTLGATVFEQHYNIGGVTGGANDSAIFPQQNNTYATPTKVISYPLAVNTSWNSKYTDVVNFKLTIAAYSLNNVPSIKKTYTVRHDTVVGWGTAKVPTLSGSATAPVLMVKRTIVTIDSFFMGGGPAPGALLTAFGLVQGQQKTNNRYSFWRRYSIYPFLIFNYGSNNFTTPSSIYFDGNGTTAGMEDLVNSIEVSLYPNPVSDVLKISGINNSDVSITDLSGKVLKTIKHSAISETVDVSNFSTGTYMVRISNQQNTLVKKFTVVR